jgi:hypothetical protein
MKFGVIALFLLFFESSGIAQREVGAPVISPELTQAEFSHIAEEWRLAYNGTDASKLSHFYAEDAQYISSHIAGLVATGRDRVIANFQLGMNNGGFLEQTSEV